MDPVPRSWTRGQTPVGIHIIFANMLNFIHILFIGIHFVDNGRGTRALPDVKLEYVGLMEAVLSTCDAVSELYL